MVLLCASSILVEGRPGRGSKSWTVAGFVFPGLKKQLLYRIPFLVYPFSGYPLIRRFHLRFPLESIDLNAMAAPPLPSLLVVVGPLPGACAVGSSDRFPGEQKQQHRAVSAQNKAHNKAKAHIFSLSKRLIPSNGPSVQVEFPQAAPCWPMEPRAWETRGIDRGDVMDMTAFKNALESEGRGRWLGLARLHTP